MAVGTFTQNVVKAAPVLWDKMVVENYDSARVIAINSGVANACTGDEGIYNNELFASKVADNFWSEERRSVNLFNWCYWKTITNG